MFRVSARQIRGLQGSGGEPFTAFVDDLLRSHCKLGGLTDAQVHTNLRINLPDGGLDTTVDAGLVSDPTGWLPHPTAWQYKATDFPDVRLAELFKGDAVKDHIARGYAFRLAVADSIPPDKRLEWDAALTQKAREILLASPEARVVSADDIAAWASRLPGLVMRHFLPGVDQVARSLEAWRASAIASTPQYVGVDAWKPVMANLAQHANLSRAANAAVLPVQGDAGVGKTRMVCEVVSELAEARSLVVYCVGETDALRIASELANDADALAILIADECPVEGRFKLEAILAGHRGRIRVIAIDVTTERRAGVQPELVVAKMSRETLNVVLDINFPQVPHDRRRAYAALAEGFPQLAADLCKHDHMIAAAGGPVPHVPGVEEYLHIRLTKAQFEALAALSLVPKIGYASDVRAEFDELCSFLTIPPKPTETSLHEIHDGPGFVGRSSRYMYVTPELVAQVAVRDAYRRWAPEPRVFFDKLPPSLFPLIVERVHRSAPEEVRLACAAHFRNWALGLTPQALADDESVSQLVQLVETIPAQYLPLVTQLVEAAPLELLAQQSSTGRAWRGWGPRRAIVWLAERFAQFPQHFADAERVLLRLALAESEPQISNNATAIWVQLHRILLSGTAIAFAARLANLRAQVLGDDESVRALALLALDNVFEVHASRTLGPAVVAGMVPPSEWRPRDQRELQDCFRAALELVMEMTASGGALRSSAHRIAIDHLRTLIGRGFIKETKEILADASNTDTTLVGVVEAIDQSLAYDFADESDATARELLNWREQLATSNLHARIVASVGKGEWDASRVHAAVRGREAGSATDDPFVRELESLAILMVQEPVLLLAELPWLTSEHARSAGEFGRVLGRVDKQGVLLDHLISVAQKQPTPALVRGYVHDLVAQSDEHTARVNAFIDEAEATAPELAATLAISGGTPLRPFERALRLFDAGRLGTVYLADYNFATGRRTDLPLSTLVPLVSRLAKAAVAGDEVAERLGFDAIALRFPYEPTIEQPDELRQSPELRAAAWALLEARPGGSPPRVHWMSSLLVALGRGEPLRAARHAAGLLVGDNFAARDEGARALQLLAVTHATEVMEALGETILDEKGWKFYVGAHDDLLSSLPPAVVIEWLKKAGAEAARRVVRHVPAPYVAADGTPTVPPLTEWILTQFEDDDRTFREFCAGVHNLQMYSGDIAAEHEAEAEVARKFLNHPLRRIREWAAIEERQSAQEAEWHRREQEEFDLHDRT